jgi:prevent-host-death family protein
MVQQIFINATDARKDFFNLLRRAKKGPYPINITIKGTPEAVIMSKEDYDAWMATYETLLDTSLVEAIKKGDEDIKAGRYTSLENFKKELGLDVSSKPVKTGSKKLKKT